MSVSRADFEQEYRSVPRRRMSRSARVRIAESLRAAEAAGSRSADARSGVTAWQLVAACAFVAVVTHVVTRWTVERPPVAPASSAALGPVAVSLDAALFPTRHQTRIRAWRPATPTPENSR